LTTLIHGLLLGSSALAFVAFVIFFDSAVELIFGLPVLGRVAGSPHLDMAGLLFRYTVMLYGGLALSAILFCAGAYAPVCRVLKGRKVIGAFSVAALTPVYFVLLYTAAQIVRGLLA